MNELERVEESVERPRILTSLKRRKGPNWTKDETEKFFLVSYALLEVEVNNVNYIN